MILINGGQLIIGWENNPILTSVKIVLTGELSNVNINNLPQGFDQIKSKGIGVKWKNSNKYHKLLINYKLKLRFSVL